MSFVLPTLAAAGAVLIIRALARSLIRLAHASQGDRRLSIIPVVVNVLATLVLVISPAARLLALAMTTNDGPPHTLAGFGDWRGSEGYPLLSAHRGVDLAARPGSDVLAAADGRVVVARDSGGQRVSRGERVGAVGTTGQRAWPGYEHVHLELQHGGSPNDLEDPASRFAGCFDSARTYPTDRLRLTYPVRC